MAVQSHLPVPGYENLRLEDVLPLYEQRGERDFDMCLITQPTESASIRLRPEPVVLLSELAINGPRVLSRTEKTLIGQLPNSFGKWNGDIVEVSAAVARQARYSFYHR